MSRVYGSQRFDVVNLSIGRAESHRPVGVQATFLNTGAADGLVARQQPRSPRQRVRAGGGEQPLRHPVVDVAEAVEAPSLLELYGVVQGAPVELHVGEVLEQDVDRLDVGTLELLAS